jgi:hypothetical protein
VQRLSTTFILGYHGCDRRVAEDLLLNKPFEPSKNDYDWLGSGIYFWEANPARGLAWSRELSRHRQERRGAIEEPYVIGAVIDLGYCLDLISSKGIELVKVGYKDFSEFVRESGDEMPRNEGGGDLFLRHLDCAVMNHIHDVNKRSNQPEFDTVRGVFLEGQPIYETSGFHEKTHIQICVRNPRNIKGVFRVPTDQLEIG